MTPKKLGPYLVEDILGKGGMGTVYRGTDPETGESVALKVLSPELANDAGFLQRFQEEVETLLELRHPNIVQLLSFGRQDDCFYFAMELVEGKSLYAMQKAGHTFSPAEAVGIAVEVCEALRHSHNLGVVHRDLKPGNIIRSHQGEIKLADYGIAKRFGGSQMTNSGVLGTAEFMAPEQAKGKPATAQSDLYSLGSVIFSLIHGHPPFEESSPYRTLERVVQDSPPILSHVASGVPDELSQLVDKLLRKKPEDRFRSAQSVQTKLKEILELMHQRAEMETSIVTGNEEDFSVAQGAQATFVDPESPSDSAKTIARDRRGKDPDVNSVQQTIPDRNKRSKDSKVSASAPTIQEATTLAGSGQSNRVIRQQDFHERATRPDSIAVETEAPSRLITVLMSVGLVLILLASGYLVWDRVIRPRTPDELWARIEPYVDRPQSALEDIETFLQLYPNDDRASEVEELRELARAIQYRNKLSLRAGLNSALLDVQEDFLKHTRPDSGSEFEKASLLRSMITYYQTGEKPEETPEAKQARKKCLAVAAVFADHYEKMAAQEIAPKMVEIQDRIDLADELEAAGKPAEANEIRESVLKLFGNRTWAEELLRPIRQKVDNFRQ